MCLYSTKVSGHKHSGSRDIIIFVCHVTLQDHVIRGLCNFMVRSPSKTSYHPTKFCSHRHCNSADVMVLVCHVMSQDHVIKGSCVFMGSIP